MDFRIRGETRACAGFRATDVDVGSKSEIHSLMVDLAEQGVAIIMISSELPEILGMSDRIAVMHAGSVAGVLARDEATQSRIIVFERVEITKHGRSCASSWSAADPAALWSLEGCRTLLRTGMSNDTRISLSPPGGMDENSPAFQGWVRAPEEGKSRRDG